MTAQDIIDLIRGAGADDDQAIIYAMEDGAALEALGITDDDQEAVEEAYAIVCAGASSPWAMPDNPDPCRVTGGSDRRCS